jgi:hypothetical protein
MRAGDEVLGEGFADFLRRAAGGPVAEVILLRGGECGDEQSEDGETRNEFHRASLWSDVARVEFGA